MSKLTTGSFSIEDLESVQITINNIVGVAKEVAKEELGPMGPTPLASMAAYRNDWNFLLLNRYEPVLTPCVTSAVTVPMDHVIYLETREVPVALIWQAIQEGNSSSV